MIFQCRTDDKRKPIIDLDSIRAYFLRWKPYTEFCVEVTKISKKKIASPKQRGFYFSAVLPALLRGAGYDPDEAMLVHRQLKIIFFHVQPDSHGIYREKDIPSVFSLESNIGVEKRGNFIDWVIRKSAELGEVVEQL